jgi:YD repeat-containing protein
VPNCSICSRRPCTSQGGIGVILTYTFSPSPGSDTDTYSATTGQLTAETDPAGNTATITYGTLAGNLTPAGTYCTTAAYSCDTIVSASGQANPANGRDLVIGLTSTGTILNLTGPSGQVWQYAYAYPGTDLTKVTDPMLHPTTYSYDTSNPNPLLQADMLTIASPNAQPGGPDAGADTVNTYNTQGQVTSQTDPMGNTTAFTYCANAGTQDCLNPVTGTG